MIETAFGFFALPWVPWALSALLVLGAVAIWLYFRWHLRPVLAGLADALAVIEGARSAAGFRDRFPTIDRRLAANPIIGEAWRGFAPTVVAVPGRDDTLGATRRPVDDLNDGILATAGVNLRFYMAVPNYLVGLGLLFTFLGLVAALYFASAGVTAANIQDAQGALRDLLTAATFKFVTSIAGLGASIVYSWREKDQLYQVGRCLSRLCAALEERLVPVSPEYLGMMQLDELKTQNALMRRIGRNLHVTVPETVEERLAAELLDAVQPMREGFAQAALRLAHLDEKLTDRLTPSAAIAAPAGPLGRGDVAPLLEELRRVREAVESLPAAMPQPSATRKTGDAELARALPAFVQLFDASTKGIETLDTRLEQALAQVRSALDLVQAGFDRAGGSAEAGDQLAASLGGLADTRRELDELGRAFREVAGDSRALLDAHHDGSEARDPGLVAALDQLSRTVERFNQRVRRFVRHADEELARSSRLLTSVVGEREQETH